MRIKINLLATLVIFALSTFIILTGLSPRAVALTEGCSNATLLGNYGLHLAGFVGTQDPYTPINGTTTIAFDGEGRFTARRIISLGGKTQETPSTGSYEVQSDCAFTAVGDPIAGVVNVQSGVIVDGGRKLFSSSTAEGFNLNIVGEKTGQYHYHADWMR